MIVLSPASCEPLDDLTPRMTHGETFIPKRCTLCECKYVSIYLMDILYILNLFHISRDGSVECITMSEDLDCPALNCSKEEQILEEGKCCPICRGDTLSSPPFRSPRFLTLKNCFSEYDFCSRGHNCHKQSNCRNGIFNYSCHCNQGFRVSKPNPVTYII